jgi:hypothetical protein
MDLSNEKLIDIAQFAISRLDGGIGFHYYPLSGYLYPENILLRLLITSRFLPFMTNYVLLGH